MAINLIVFIENIVRSFLRYQLTSYSFADKNLSTGTGSGKTECFLYPIISKCLELRDKKEPSKYKSY